MFTLCLPISALTSHNTAAPVARGSGGLALSTRCQARRARAVRARDVLLSLGPRLRGPRSQDLVFCANPSRLNKDNLALLILDRKHCRFGSPNF